MVVLKDGPRLFLWIIRGSRAMSDKANVVQLMAKATKPRTALLVLLQDRYEVMLILLVVRQPYLMRQIRQSPINALTC